MRTFPTLIFVAAPLAILAAACGSDPQPPSKLSGDVTKPSATPKSSAPAAKQDTTNPSSGSIHIDDKIIQACGNLPTAHFAFDSTTIIGDAAVALDALAQCFTAGPLKGRKMRVVGHTDPRGDAEYNLGLGQKRAGSVAEYLTKKSVDQAKIATSSKGEFEASGTDEQGWARDRKVEIFLAD
jgi:peptidoglycan-associated lipoprotein